MDSGGQGVTYHSDMIVVDKMSETFLMPLTLWRQFA